MATPSYLIAVLSLLQSALQLGPRHGAGRGYGLLATARRYAYAADHLPSQAGRGSEASGASSAGGVDGDIELKISSAGLLEGATAAPERTIGENTRRRLRKARGRGRGRRPPRSTATAAAEVPEVPPTTGGRSVKCRQPCPFEETPRNGSGTVLIKNLGMRTLYHVTTKERCPLIKNTNFKPGARGLYGPGIYFAASCAVGHHKMDPKAKEDAMNEGGFCCITAKVNMTRSLLPVGGPVGAAPWMTALLAEEFGAGTAFAKEGPRRHKGRTSEPEYMAYSNKQVKIIATAPFDPPFAPLVDAAALVPGIPATPAVEIQSPVAALLGKMQERRIS